MARHGSVRSTLGLDCLLQMIPRSWDGFPDSPDVAVIAVDGNERRLGAVWWVLREPPLVRDPAGSPLPELAMAVVENERRKGIGQALLDEIVERLAGSFRRWR